MTVSVDQIAKAKAAGLKNVDIAAQVADEVPDIIFYQLCALFEKESYGGKNMYGNDKIKLPDGTYTRKGVALSGFPEPVNKSNYAVFWYEVFTIGYRSNGVGPLQLTSKTFHTDMRAQGLEAWEPYDSVTFGAKLWTGYYRGYRAQGDTVSEAIVKAGCKYNTGSSDPCEYGDRLLVIMDKWRDRVGISDAQN